MIAPQQRSTQDSPPDDLLAKLRKRLDYRWREVTEQSAINPTVALERGYYLVHDQGTFWAMGRVAYEH